MIAARVTDPGGYILSDDYFYLSADAVYRHISALLSFSFCLVFFLTHARCLRIDGSGLLAPEVGAERKGWDALAA